MSPLADLISCSQIRITRYPSCESAASTWLARSTFLLIFARQNVALDFGIGRPHAVQPCQKQPSVKMATRRRLKAKSGHPGSSRT